MVPKSAALVMVSEKAWTRVNSSNCKTCTFYLCFFFFNSVESAGYLKMHYIFLSSDKLLSSTDFSCTYFFI